MTPDDVRLGKPHPESLELCLQAHGLEPREAVMVGDSFKEDVEPARAAGLRAIWFNERSAEERTGEHMATLHHLDHLQGLLTAWGILKRI